MTAGDLTPGRRVASFDEVILAGDYYRSREHLSPAGEVQDDQVWFLLPIHTGESRFQRNQPGDGLHRVSSPPWIFTEYPDGSLEVRESIACGRGSKPDQPGGGEYWHGYLDAGNIWREV